MIRSRVPILCCLLTACLLSAQAVLAHDPSAWGGMFRTRDAGGTWLPIDGGMFIGGAIALAIDPADPNHLLYATDTRLLRSHNGGRDWVPEQASVFYGPTLAVAFDARGKTALAATSAGMYGNDGTREWTPVAIPAAASPIRAIVPGAAGHYFVAGARGLYRTADAGATWQRIGESLPETPATALVVRAQPIETVYAVIEGTVWASPDGGASWAQRSAGLPAGRAETIAFDASTVERLWSAAEGRLYISDDAGQTWRAHGAPVPEAGISIRGIAVSRDGSHFALTTHRGVYRSHDSGNSWALVESNLPVHLEAGPMVRDPSDPDTFYAGFSLTPFGEIWRRAEQGNSLLSQIDPVSLAGGGAFLGLLAVGGVLLVRRLARRAGSVGSPTTKSS
jgi:photosystem II stability/assembly factor-like uncharacterized protein